MKRSYLNIISFVFICFFACCTKDPQTLNTKTLIVSPQKMIMMTGEDWSTLEPQIKNKTGYQYNEIPQNPNNVKAVITLRAVEEGNDSVYYILLLSISRSSGKVIRINMQTTDSLKTTDQELAYNLMLKYYDAGLRPITDTTNTVGAYHTSNGAYVNTFVNEILSKLIGGVESSMLSISYYSAHNSFYIDATQFPGADNYIFSFVGDIN